MQPGLGKASQKATGARRKQSCCPLQGWLGTWAKSACYQLCVFSWFLPHTVARVPYFIGIKSVFPRWNLSSHFYIEIVQNSHIEDVFVYSEHITPLWDFTVEGEIRRSKETLWDDLHVLMCSLNKGLNLQSLTTHMIRSSYNLHTINFTASWLLFMECSGEDCAEGSY